MDQRRRHLGSIGECGKREMDSYVVKREASRHAAGNLKQGWRSRFARRRCPDRRYSRSSFTASTAGFG